MGVVCQILINKTKEGVFKAGEAVTGIVKYAVDEPTEYKAVTLSLLGTGECSWTETNTGKDRSSRTYYGTETYIKNRLNILCKEQKTALLNIGSYEYPFEFHLPENLPSSFKNYTCTISYRIQIKFEIENFFSLNKKFKAEIPVNGFIEPAVEAPVIFGLEKTLVKLFSSKKPIINLKAEILKTCLTPGENIQLVLVLTNDTDIVPLVRAELHCYTTYKADCGSTNENIDRIQDCSAESPEIPARGVANLTLTIPTKPELYTICSKVMIKEYKLKVTVRLPMPHKNAVVEIPVAIGERKDQNTELALDATDDVEDGPPSYWEAMAEDKEKE